MGKKLLAMDLDGTAVCDDYSMGPESKLALLEARQAGHVTAFVTGRRDVDMLSMGQDQWCVDYQILNTGGKILRCADRKVLHNALIPPEACYRLITHCMNEDLQLQVCSGMLWQVTKLSDGTLAYADQLGILPQLVRAPDDIPWQEGLEGFMATQDMAPVAKYIDEKVPEVYYVNSEPGTIDIMPRGATKWHGICLLADMLGIAREDIITVGNYYNDMDMLREAPAGIAVANALEPVKRIADFVTERDNNHEAVAEIIRNMLQGMYDLPHKGCKLSPTGEHNI